MKKSFTFRSSWARIIAPFDDKLRFEIYGATVMYYFEDRLPDNLSAEARVAMAFIIADIEKARKTQLAAQQRKAKAAEARKAQSSSLSDQSDQSDSFAMSALSAPNLVAGPAQTDSRRALLDRGVLFVRPTPVYPKT